jgi:3-oxoacyl-[acyl-carrier protein] reductase
MISPSPLVALVTGGGKGIGSACASALAADGIHVYINYLSDAAAAEQTRDAIRKAGGRVTLCAFDITDTAQSGDAVKTIIRETGKIDILVNNAGLREDRLLAMMKKEAWQRVLDTNLTGFFNLTKPIVKQMLKRKFGRIINITSTAGILGNAGQVNYSASKAGLIGATRALAREVASRNITVNAVAPGFIDTQMLEGLEKQDILNTVPAGRLGKPEEVAGIVAFLCSHNAAYINGQVIGVNGGMI